MSCWYTDPEGVRWRVIVLDRESEWTRGEARPASCAIWFYAEGRERRCTELSSEEQLSPRETECIPAERLRELFDRSAAVARRA
jgi:hypothetical protein